MTMVLEDEQLREPWQRRLEKSVQRHDDVRLQVNTELAQRMPENFPPPAVDENGEATHGGLFNLWRMSEAQVKRLRDEHAIYVVPIGDGLARANYASINDSNRERIVDSVETVMKTPGR